MDEKNGRPVPWVPRHFVLTFLLRKLGAAGGGSLQENLNQRG